MKRCKTFHELYLQVAVFFSHIHFDFLSWYLRGISINIYSVSKSNERWATKKKKLEKPEIIGNIFFFAFEKLVYISIMYFYFYWSWTSLYTCIYVYVFSDFNEQVRTRSRAILTDSIQDKRNWVLQCKPINNWDRT